MKVLFKLLMRLRNYSKYNRSIPCTAARYGIAETYFECSKLWDKVPTEAKTSNLRAI